MPFCSAFFFLRLLHTSDAQLKIRIEIDLICNIQIAQKIQYENIESQTDYFTFNKMIYLHRHFMMVFFLSLFIGTST